MSKRKSRFQIELMYRFRPPIEATGSVGRDENEMLFRHMKFESGILIAIKDHSFEFQVQKGGHIYTFFVPRSYSKHIILVKDKFGDKTK